MKRRKFISGSLVSISAAGMLGTSTYVSAAKEMPVKKLIVCFREETLVAAGDGRNWEICVLADPRLSQRPPFIRLKLQVSEDENFERIVSEQRCLAQLKNSYIVRVSYEAPNDYNELFFRFVAIDVQSRQLARGRTSEYHTSPAKRLIRTA